MQRVLPSSERKHSHYGWLESHHSFPIHSLNRFRSAGFRCLCAVNEDRLAGGRELPLVSPADMEVLTYVVEGALCERNSEGQVSRLETDEIQKISSPKEGSSRWFNALTDQDTHFLQIWIAPENEHESSGQSFKKNLSKDFETKSLLLVASPDGEDNSALLHQDVFVHLGKFKSGEERHMFLEGGRCAWIQVISGELTVNGTRLSISDGMALSGEVELRIHSQTESEFFVFDLP